MLDRQMLCTDVDADFSHLVPLRESGIGRPLFVIHGIFGDVSELHPLAERLTTERPIYALQARGVDLRQEPHSSIGEMVDAYARSIRSVQPAGPYALAGYSLGGLIAFELARRFRAEREAIEVLALLEARLYERYLPLRDKLVYWFVLPRRVFGKLRTLPARDVTPYLASKAAQLGHRVMLRLGLRDDFHRLEEMSGPMAGRRRQMYHIGISAFRTFKPKPYDGTISLFTIKGPRFDGCDPLPIWQRAAKSVELFEIVGTHSTIMEIPNVDTLARQLDRCLAAPQAPARMKEPPEIRGISEGCCGASQSSSIGSSD
jgi:acetoacetyl-CoA synthetase